MTNELISDSIEPMETIQASFTILNWRTHFGKGKFLAVQGEFCRIIDVVRRNYIFKACKWVCQGKLVLTSWTIQPG